MLRANKRERMAERITKHGRQLLQVFPKAVDTDPIVLCKRLRRLELEASKHAERQCNGGPGFLGEEAADAAVDKLLARVDAILNFQESKVPVFYNGDPRGYALKIDDKWLRNHHPEFSQRDWGGYGLLAPDLAQE